MPKFRYDGMMMMLCMVILLCTAAGCINFGAMMPGSGQGGAGSGGAGPVAAPAGGSGSGSGGGGGLGGGGSGGGLPSGSGGSAASECGELTPMHTYFTVNCHYHAEVGTKDTGRSIEDIAVSGDIPIEMVREWDKYGMDNFASQGGKVNYRYVYHKICDPTDDRCGDCKYTFEGPAYGSVKIRRADSVTTYNWMADFWFEGPKAYSEWISMFNQNDFSPFDCPPRLGWYAITGGAGPKNAPADVQQVLPGCTGDSSQEDMNGAADTALVVCGPLDSMPFVLRDGEVITDKRIDDGGEAAGYRTVDATHTFHITAR